MARRIHLTSIFSIYASAALSALPASADVKIVSWNMKHLGRASQDLPLVASALTGADLVMLQEVDTGKQGATALTKLAALVSETTKSRYCVGLSEIPTDARERYGMLWREDSLAYVTTKGTLITACPEYAVTLRLGAKGAEKIVREPAVALFQERATSKKFMAVTIHTVPTAKHPENEVPYVFESATDAAGKFPVVVGGDFNLGCDHSAFVAALGAQFVPAIPCQTKTSLKMKARAFNAAYDNLLSRGMTSSGGTVVNVYILFEKLSHSEIYKKISDHAPVTATFSIDDEAAAKAK